MTISGWIRSALAVALALFVCLVIPAGALAHVGSPGDVSEAPPMGYRLLVGLDDVSDVRSGDAVLDSYEGVMLLGFSSQDELEAALSHYEQITRFAAVDQVVSIAEPTDGSPDGGEESVAAHPFVQLSDEVDPVSARGPLIALIDTGAPESPNVVARTSVIGGGSDDENGHGTQMLQAIVAQNPDAEVISVKALGADGTGTAASVYAAIVYAVEAGADIINLSFSAHAPAGNAAIASAIESARANGVRVVTSAGNQNADAGSYVPASIGGVVTVGALRPDGQKQELSNYGACVDVWVEAPSTSHAAAMIAGWLSAQGAQAALEACAFASLDPPPFGEGEDDGGVDGQAEPGSAWDEEPSGDAVRYVLTFDSNGGEGEMPDVREFVELGAYRTSRLPKCAFTREGFRFVGWKTTVPDNGVENVAPILVPDGQVLCNLSYEVERDGEPWALTLASYADKGRIPLTAVWADGATGVVEGLDDVTEDGMGLEFGVDTSSTSTKSLYMYRYSSSHSYLSFTASSSQTANGYTFTGRTTLATVPTSSNSPFYGCYNPNAKYQWCWGPLVERNSLVQAGWATGGITFYSDDAKGIPVYRFFKSSNGAHTWSTASSMSGWPCEGCSFYGLKFYKVAYAGNGATSGSMSAQTYQYGITYTLASNAFARTGYAFNGWSGSNGGSYSNGQRVSNLTSSSGATVTLSAKWKANSYTIAFDANGGQGAMGNQSAAYDAPVSLSPNSFTRPGYRFAGWNTAADGGGQAFQEGQSVQSLASENGAVVTLHAQWEPLQLEFSCPTELGFNLHADGRLDLAADSEGVVNEGDAGIVVDGIRVSTPAGLLLAQGNPGPNEYALMLTMGATDTLNLADFVGAEFTDLSGLAKMRIAAHAVQPVSAAAGSCGGLSEEVLSSARLGTVEWRVTMGIVTVSYDPNGGEGAMDSQMTNAGIGFAVPKCGFSCTGKTFAGWNTQADGRGNAYAIGDVISCDVDTVLYAQWV